MSKPLTLESFDGLSAQEQDNRAALSEEEWLKVFEKGYKDGWDDATRTHSTSQEHVGAELANAVEQISFTLVEARTKTLADLKPLMNAVFESVFLPSLDHLLLEQLLSKIGVIAQDMVDSRAEIAVAPDNLDRLQKLSGDMAHKPVRFVADPTLGAGQAFVRIADTEQKIDLPGTLTEIRQIVDDFFEMPDHEKDRAHG